MYSTFKKGIQKIKSISRSFFNWADSRKGFGFSFFGTTAAGINVSAENALSFPAVFACVKSISDDIASLPFKVFTKTDNGKIIAENHDQQYLISKRPNQFYSKVNYLKALISNFLLWGNAFALIIRNKASGRPISYQVLESKDVQVVKDEQNGRLVDVFYHNTKSGEIYDSMDIIHIADFTTDGIIGKSRIKIARETVAQGIGLINYASKYYRDGGALSGVVESDGHLTNEALAKAQQTFTEAFGGGDNVGGVGFLPKGMKFKQVKMSMPLTDMEYMASRKFVLEEIARIFGVPPHKIGHLEKSSFNNIHEQNMEYVQNTLLPIVTMIEEEHNAKIFTHKEEKQSFVKIELKGLLRGDIKQRSEFYTKMIDRAVLSPNDVLRLEDMPTYEGGEIRILPSNYLSIEKFDDPDFRKVAKPKKEKEIKQKKSKKNHHEN